VSDALGALADMEAWLTEDLSQLKTTIERRMAQHP